MVKKNWVVAVNRCCNTIPYAISIFSPPVVDCVRSLSAIDILDKGPMAIGANNIAFFVFLAYILNQWQNQKYLFLQLCNKLLKSFSTISAKFCAVIFVHLLAICKHLHHSHALIKIYAKK